MTSRLKKRLGTVLTGLALAAVLTVGVAGPSRADDRDWRSHESAARHWHAIHRRPVSGVVYAPPVVVAPPPYYAPQPVYAAPSAPGLNFIIPLHIH